MVEKCKSHHYITTQKGKFVCTECGHVRISTRKTKRIAKIVSILIICVVASAGFYYANTNGMIQKFLMFISEQISNISQQIQKDATVTNNSIVSSKNDLVIINKTAIIPQTNTKKIQQPSTSSISKSTNDSTNMEVVPLQNTPVKSQITSAELRNYALQLINDDRAKSGLPPVKLGNNPAAQVHAEDMLKVRFLSHYMTDGEKPYMVYTKYGGLGYVAQNAAFQGYQDISQCKNPNTICDAIVPKDAIRQAEDGMMNNDQASNWGHRDNILDKDHTTVSIGIAYDQYSFYMVQNFENNYLQYAIPISENNGMVIFSGTSLGGTIDNVEIAYDELPTSITYDLHKNDGFYKLGDYMANVQAPVSGNEQYAPSNSTFEVADKWNVQASSVDISFDLTPLVTKPGVYTIVVYLKNNGESIPVTSYSITKTSALVQAGFKSPNVYYPCTSIQFEQYNQLKQQSDTLNQQINSLKPKVQSMPSTVPESEYASDMAIINQYNGLITEYNNLINQMNNFRC